MNKNILLKQCINLLKKLIETPSFSKKEDKTAYLIEQWLVSFGIQTNRNRNNVWATNKYFDESKPTILLNSHHDTVKPNEAYTNNPFEAKEINGRIYGLGSNDAGGSLVSLLYLFVFFYERQHLKYNLIMSATAEEEISGKNGIASILKHMPNIDFAVVGEPTEMELAIAEKGLLVIDGCARGISGHAANKNTKHAIYKAVEDINWIRNYTFPKSSEILGHVNMNITQINAGFQHNVVPAECHFVVDVRVNDLYNNREIFQTINLNTKSKLEARSYHLGSSSIDINHPIIKAGEKLGRKTYGSHTLSDQVFLSSPSLKLWPGKSERSHSANEFIKLTEIEEGIELYINIFKQIL